MADDFLARIPGLPEPDLRAYLAGARRYRREAVEAAAAELQRRGLPLSPGEWAALRPEPEPPRTGLFRDAAGPRLPRIRLVTGLILGAGAAGALAARIWAVRQDLPFELEPTDSKVYLRQMEMVAGKSNLVASQLRHGWEALWAPPALPWTLLVLALALAGVFWRVTTRP